MRTSVSHLIGYYILIQLLTILITGIIYLRIPKESSAIPKDSSAIPRNAPWTPAWQEHFEEKITHLTVAAGLPLSWVDNGIWLDFVQEFVPGAKSPSRKVLTSQLIPHTAAKLQTQMKAAVKGMEGTVQADGWTGLNSHHLITVMVTVEGKVCIGNLSGRSV
jgi:hypothetical protein